MGDLSTARSRQSAVAIGSTSESHFCSLQIVSSASHIGGALNQHRTFIREIMEITRRGRFAVAGSGCPKPNDCDVSVLPQHKKYCRVLKRPRTEPRRQSDLCHWGLRPLPYPLLTLVTRNLEKHSTNEFVPDKNFSPIKVVPSCQFTVVKLHYRMQKKVYKTPCVS